MPRYALAVEYDGSEFLGWQSQTHGPTLQQTLERALSAIAVAPITVVCAGRTDSGVHATGQIVHFDSPVARAPRAWMLGSNSFLPKAMAVRWAGQVDADFHARYSALSREYLYRLLNRQARPALLQRTLSWERAPLDLQAMQQAAACLVGEHDFSSFRTIACQARSPRRRLDFLRIERVAEVLEFRVQANAFVHHMVRNLVGSLIMVGRGERSVAWLADVLAMRDRAEAGPTAPPNGLLFLGPRYAARWGLPAEFAADPALEAWLPLHLREPHFQ